MADAQQPIDLTPLLNLIRGIQATSGALAPEPAPDLPNGGYSQGQAQRWIVWRNAKIQAAQVPQNVKNTMIAGDDVGDNELVRRLDDPQSFRTRDNPLIQPGPGGAPIGAREVPGSADKNAFWNANPSGEGPNIAPYNAPGVQEDRVQQIRQLLQQLSPQKPDERQNPEDMFTPEENLARNQAYAKPGPYLTALPPEQEAQFQAWVKANNVNWKQGDQDYDMRGYWLAQQQGNPNAKAAIDPNDKQIHYPDTFKTPYAATFSNESRYALPVAPQWKGDQYVLPNGHVQYDDQVGRWFEQPGTSRPKKDDSP